MFKKAVCFVVFFALTLALSSLGAQTEEEVLKIRDEIQSAEYTVNMSTANTAQQLKPYLERELARYGSDISVTVTVTSLSPAVPATEPDGADGSFTFVAQLRTQSMRLTTSRITGVISSRAYTVTATADKSTAESGESVTLTATVVDIDEPTFEWYRSTTPDGAGEREPGGDGSTHTPVLSTSGEVYFYCMCGTVRSNYVKIEVIPATVAVTDITLSPPELVAGQASALDAQVVPADATRTEISWTCEGGAVEGNLLTPRSEGEITLTAVIRDGVSEGEDYIKVFTLTVSSAQSAQTQPEAPPPAEAEQVISADGVSGLISLTVVTAGDGLVRLTQADETLRDEAIAAAKEAAVPGDVLFAVSVDYVRAPGAARASFTVSDELEGQTVEIIYSDLRGEVSKSRTVVSGGRIAAPEAKTGMYIVMKADSGSVLSSIIALAPALLCPPVITAVFVGVFMRKPPVCRKNKRGKSSV